MYSFLFKISRNNQEDGPITISKENVVKKENPNPLDLSVTKKEDERNVCLDAVKSLYWRGKVNFYGVAELTKKKIQKRKKEHKRSEQENA